MKVLSIDEIRLDGDTQCRVSINEETVEDYTEKIQEANGEWPFDPIDVFHDGTDHFAADGFHRTLAAIRAKRASIPCTVHRGTAKDARIFGMTANDHHGLRMNRADKRSCVEWLLDNEKSLPQKEIAAKAGVSKRLVQTIVAERRSAQNTEKAQIAPSSGESGKDGKKRSETGKPGGTVGMSSSKHPVESDPVTDSTAAESEVVEDDEIDEDEAPETPGNGTEPTEGPGDSSKGRGKEKPSASKLVDELTRSHIGHVARGLTSIAEVNGGEGEQFRTADAGLNQLIGALKEMREGKR